MELFPTFLIWTLEVKTHQQEAWLQTSLRYDCDFKLTKTTWNLTTGRTCTCFAAPDFEMWIKLFEVDNAVLWKCFYFVVFCISNNCWILGGLRSAALGFEKVNMNIDNKNWQTWFCHCAVTCGDMHLDLSTMDLHVHVRHDMKLSWDKKMTW